MKVIKENQTAVSLLILTGIIGALTISALPEIQAAINASLPYVRQYISKTYDFPLALGALITVFYFWFTAD